MANTTIYPYGTGGQLPSFIGVINDLVTGDADKALSAEMGKKLRKAIASLLNALSPTAFTGEKPTDTDIDIYAPKFTITLPTDTRVDMTNQNAQVEAGDSYTNTFSLNETAEVGYVLLLSASMEGGGEISADSTTGVVSTNNVTGNITITASAGVPPTKVHSWSTADWQGSEDNKPRYLEDNVAGAFRLYLIGDVNSLSPSWTPSGGSYSGVCANGKSDNYTAGYGNRDIQVGNGDFTIAMRNVKIAFNSNQMAAYNMNQPRLQFYDSSNVSSVHNGQSQYANRQFAIQLSYDVSSSGSATVASQSMYPYIEYVNNGEQKALMNSAGIPCTIPSGHVYNVFYTYTKATGAIKSYVVDVYNNSATVTQCGTVDTGNTNIEIACLCIKGPGAGTWATKDYIAGIDLYNYAMSQADIETEFSNN